MPIASSAPETRMRLCRNGIAPRLPLSFQPGEISHVPFAEQDWLLRPRLTETALGSSRTCLFGRDHLTRRCLGEDSAGERVVSFEQATNAHAPRWIGQSKGVRV